MATPNVPNLPVELWDRILAFSIFGFPLLPSPTERLVNDLKFLSEDCELAVAYDRSLLRLRGVCRGWRHMVDRLVPIHDQCNQWLILDGVIDPPPSASRLHFRGRDINCECKSPRCRFSNPLAVHKSNDVDPQTYLSNMHSKEAMAQMIQDHQLHDQLNGVTTDPPFRAYTSYDAPTEAILSSVSIRPTEAITPIITGTVKPQLRLLAAAVDFSCAPPFSLPALSSACPNLTHLSLSDLYLPDGPANQTLDLPHLTTLILDFYHPESSPPGSTTAIHPSVSNWNIPRLRHLGLKGWIDDDASPLFSDIDKLLEREGHKLEGLLYNVWTRHPETKDEVPQRLPAELWTWCPQLHSIQVPLIVLFANGPQAPIHHPKLSVIPVCHGNLKFLRDKGKLLWPPVLIHRLPHHTVWPIERFCTSSTWSTFHRKLLHYHRESTQPDQFGRRKQDAGYWRGYFREWIHRVFIQGYILEDRYGVNIHQGAGQDLLRWLSGDESATATLGVSGWWYPGETGNTMNLELL